MADRSAVVRASVAPPDSRTLRGDETILLVEDDERVRSLARTILRRYGYNVLDARGGGGMLCSCANSFEPTIQLLLTDAVMPRMSGRKLAERLLQLRPDMKVMYMSGYTDDAVVRHGVFHSTLAFIEKPITPEALARKVRKCSDQDRRRNRAHQVRREVCHQQFSAGLVGQTVSLRRPRHRSRVAAGWGELQSGGDTVGRGAPTAVVTDLYVTDLNGNLSVHTADPVTGRFTYLPFTSNVNSVLAQWDTTGDLLWTVLLSTFDGGGNPVGTDSHVVQLDKTAPEASVKITSGTGNCGRSPVGTPISGTFVARDKYFGHYAMYIEPAVNPGGVGVPSPNGGTEPTGTTLGDDNWSLDTNQMKPCGYVIRIDVADRAIVDSQWVGHPNSDSAGFCLLDPVEEVERL